MIDAVRTFMGGGWLLAARQQARAAPFTTAGLALAVLAVMALLLQSLQRILNGEVGAVVRYALLGG